MGRVEVFLPKTADSGQNPFGVFSVEFFSKFVSIPNGQNKLDRVWGEPFFRRIRTDFLENFKTGKKTRQIGVVPEFSVLGKKLHPASHSPAFLRKNATARYGRFLPFPTLRNLRKCHILLSGRDAFKQ